VLGVAEDFRWRYHAQDYSRQQENGYSLQARRKLSGPWVEELRKCWLAAASKGKGQSFLVDLSAVDMIDSKGRALLVEMHQQGTKLEGAGLMTQAIIEEITASKERIRGGALRAAGRYPV
jgi:anti-anti-sigma regulatory factor